MLVAKPDSTAMLKKMLTEIIRQRIQTEFEPQAKVIIAEVLGIVERSYDNCFEQVSQDLFWMEQEDKTVFLDMRWLRVLYSFWRRDFVSTQAWHTKIMSGTKNQSRSI